MLSRRPWRDDEKAQRIRDGVAELSSAPDSSTDEPLNEAAATIIAKVATLNRRYDQQHAPLSASLRARVSTSPIRSNRRCDAALIVRTGVYTPWR